MQDIPYFFPIVNTPISVPDIVSSIKVLPNHTNGKMATYQAGLHHQLRRILAGEFHTAFDLLCLLSRTVVQIPSLALRSLRRIFTIKGAPSPDRVKRPRPAGRRRRRFTPERSYPSSTPPIHTTWQSAAAAQALLGTTSQMFLSSSKLPRNRFKSRQHAHHWHNLQNPSVYGPLPEPPAPKLPRIELHFKALRGSLNGCSKFRQYFKYDAPANPDPTIDMQAQMEDIYENPVRIVDGHDVYKAPGYEQPTMVAHKMYWTGEGEEIAPALTEALNRLLTNLSITHCRLSLSDVISILHMSPSLSTFEVHDIESEENGAVPSIDYSPQDQVESMVSSLTVTSFVPLNDLFKLVQLKNMFSISLRLRGGAKDTDFTQLQAHLTSNANRSSFRLRTGIEFPPVKMSELQKTMESAGVACDFACIP
ncbi:hypothetical protein NMY22_g4300 [Coprinellus aureogranulatus]|nr:hypothetical protein NMY22_g4300 [Coprinellus aureogranulatus]